MKTKVRLLTDNDIAVLGQTFSRGSKGREFEIATDELQSEEIKFLIEQRTIEIVKEPSPQEEES